MNIKAIGLAVLAALNIGAAYSQQDNTGYGTSALGANPTGPQNSAFGAYSMAALTTGGYNTAVGYQTLASTTDALSNTAVGYSVLYQDTSGSYNTAMGLGALMNVTTGSYNTVLGANAMPNADVAGYNTAVGSYALVNNFSGNNNIALGYYAGYWPTGSNNIDIGAKGNSKDDSVIRIGTQGTQKAVVIAGIRGTKITGGLAVVVNSNGQLGTVSGLLAPVQAPALTEQDVRRIVRQEMALQKCTLTK